MKAQQNKGTRGSSTARLLAAARRCAVYRSDDGGIATRRNASDGVTESKGGKNGTIDENQICQIRRTR